MSPQEIKINPANSLKLGVEGKQIPNSISIAIETKSQITNHKSQITIHKSQFTIHKSKIKND